MGISMSPESITSVLLSIPIGLLSGLYAGIIVARYQRFADLRNQAVRIIREIDFFLEGQRIRLLRRTEVPELVLISSDLIFIKHRKAGKDLLHLMPEIHESLFLAPLGQISFEVFSSNHKSWQTSINALKPNKLQLFSFFAPL